MSDNSKIQNLKINSVVYCLVKADLIPCKIVEKNISIKESGEVVKHKCKISLGGQEKTFYLEDSKLKYFLSIEEARNFLMENAKKQVEQILNAAISIQEKYLKVKNEKEIPVNNSFMDFVEEEHNEVEIENEEMVVELGDGSLQKVKISENVKKLLSQQNS